MATLERKFVFVRWHYQPKSRLWKDVPTAKDAKESFPVSEDVYPTLDAAIEDMADGQVEDVVQVVEVDLDAGTARDLTKAAQERADDIAEERERERSYPAFGDRW